MRKTDTVSKMLNWILGIIYVPLSFFSWLLQMASEGTINATNSIYISLISVFSFIAFIIPGLCLVGIVTSIVLRRRGQSILSIVVCFLPLAIFILNLLLLVFAESLPTRI